jgi:hypothetical protein
MKSLSFIGSVNFPAPSGIMVNMMPFIMGRADSIPENMRGYLPLIFACGLEREQFGKIGYLTITESAVTAERPSHRRPGIHTEKHPSIGWGGGWGGPEGPVHMRRDGIYMASTVDRSCRAWHFHVDTPGTMGDCEHLRDLLECSAPVYMRSGDLFWMTDSCPHESLPLAPGTFRQYFRLVTHKVDLWYEKHSTANPLGVQPACKVIAGNKFQEVA